MMYCDVRLSQQCGGGTVGIDGTDDAVLTPPPAAADQRSERVGARANQVGYVVALYLEARAVGREAGRELAVSGDVEHGRGHFADDIEVGGEVVSGPECIRGTAVGPWSSQDPWAEDSVSSGRTPFQQNSPLDRGCAQPTRPPGQCSFQTSGVVAPRMSAAR